MLKRLEKLRMSGFSKCIINGIKEGLISEDQGRRLYDNFLMS